MSPFTYANQIKDPILLIHGMADNNTGTFPVQSERMYAALKGNGATVRYVQLPAESHGYAARESMALRFEKLDPQIKEFSFVDGQGGEKEMTEPETSKARFWNFLRVTLK